MFIELANILGDDFFMYLTDCVFTTMERKKEVEEFLHSINFPYTVGYGMTECGPIICYEDWTRFKPGSCGKAGQR